MSNSTEKTQQNVIKEMVRQAIVVSRIFTSDFQKEGTVTAELKQTITTTSKYPGKSVSNDLQDNLFAVEDFGFETKDFTSNVVNVAWMDVPVGTTIQQIEAKLNALPKATIRRIIDTKPILHSGQQARLETLSTVEEAQDLFNQIANRQVLRFSASNEETPNELILDKLGRPQYKATFFSAEGLEDDDRRSTNAEDYYASPEIKAELVKSVQHVTGQTV